MPFTISPGVVTKEIDLTTVVPEISMTEGAIAGPFRWGPSYWSTTVSNETELVSQFGKPDAASYKTFFTAASYLAYSGSLKVVRTPNITDAKNATMDSSNTVYVANDETYENTYDPDMGGTQSDDFGPFVAKYAGDFGNSLRVSMCGATRANTNSDGTLNSNTDVALTVTSAVVSGTALTGVGSTFRADVSVGDVLFFNSKYCVVETVTSDTALVVTAAADIANTGLCTRRARSAFGQPASDMIGTCAASANGVTITGTDTSFLTQYTIGDLVKLVGTNEERKVSAIASGTSMTVSEPFVAVAAANTHSRRW